MRDNQPVPLIGRPSKEYSEADMARILRTLEIYLASVQEVGPVRVSTINISNIPTSATGLRSGDVWSDSGTLKIVS